MPTMMRDATISFPLLGDWSIDPSASFTLFGHTFYWYGAIIAVGFILAMLYCARHCRRCGIKPDTLYDFLIWMIPLAIIGARLYYVIFQWSDYREHPLNAFKIWEGGLAIYGGVIAGILTGIIWCRKRKIPFGAIMDKSYILDVIDIIKKSDGNQKYKVFAVIAPSISSQFSYAKLGQVITVEQAKLEAAYYTSILPIPKKKNYGKRNKK